VQHEPTHAPHPPDAQPRRATHTSKRLAIALAHAEAVNNFFDASLVEHRGLAVLLPYLMDAGGSNATRASFFIRVGTLLITARYIR
jgi:hypothetical protein